MNISNRRPEDRTDSIRQSVIIFLSCLIGLAAVGTVMFVVRFQDPLFSDEILSNYFAYFQDLPVVGLLIIFSLSQIIRPSFHPDLRPFRYRIGTIAIATFGITLVGTYVVFRDYPLSLDEFMANFDAQIIREGKLLLQVPVTWRPFADALQPLFMLKLSTPSVWSSSYLPGNAALRAIAGLLGGSPLANPFLAASSLLLVYGVARKMEPDDRSFAIIAALLLASSSQFLIASMTAYAMPAHLAFNLAWLWLILHDRPWSRCAAIATSFVACGLHQMIFHPLFVAPFLFWLWCDGRRSQAILYFSALAAAAFLWLGYWPLALQLSGASGVQVNSLGAEYGTFAQISMLLKNSAQMISVVYVVDNIIRFISWQNPLLWILIISGGLTWLPRHGLSFALQSGIALTIVAVLILMPLQGHGWGYRYLHGLLGNFALVGALGWKRLQAGRSVGTVRPSRDTRLHQLVSASLAASFFVLLPIRAVQANTFAAPYRQANARISAIDADIVIIDDNGRWYSIDLVRNSPFLDNRPLRMAAMRIGDQRAEFLCKHFHVKVIGRASPELDSLRHFGDPRTFKYRDAQLRAWRTYGCSV